MRGPTHPVSDVEETLFICEVKQEEETHRIPKERSRQTPKPDIIRGKTEKQKNLSRNVIN